MSEKEIVTDSIGRLPDDLLLSIIKYLPTKDVVRTGILSKRWRNLHTHVNFDCLHIFGVSHDYCYRRDFEERFIEMVDEFMVQYSDSRNICCHLTCCFTKSFPNKFEEWFRALGRLAVERLTLNFHCFRLIKVEEAENPIFSCQLISEAPSLQFLSLRSCILQPNLKSQCSSLISLRLTYVTINSDAMDCILTNCSNLQSLVMERCCRDSNISISGPNLRDLSIINCNQIDLKIEINANNLTRFKFFGVRMGLFTSFNHVPQLEDISIQLSGYSFREMLHKPTVINMCSKLRRFDLELNMLLPKLSDVPVLDVCPLLQELNFSAKHACPMLEKIKAAQAFDYEQQVNKTSVKIHTKLKKVRFSGFSGATSETELALYILTSAIAMEEMYVSCSYKYEDKADFPRREDRTPLKEDKLHTLFQAHAISKSAKISVNHSVSGRSFKTEYRFC